MQAHKLFIHCNVKLCEDVFPFSSASQTLTLVPSTLVLPLHDSSYSNIYSNRIPLSISSSPPPSIPSPDSPTNYNPIPPDTPVSLRCSTRTKQHSAWHNNYEMSYAANYLTSSSSPNMSTRHPLHHYLSFSSVFPTQSAFLSLITARHKLKLMMR